MNKKTITTLIVIVVLIALFWISSILVSNLNIVELLRKLHGG